LDTEEAKEPIFFTQIVNPRLAFMMAIPEFYNTQHLDYIQAMQSFSKKVLICVIYSAEVNPVYHCASKDDCCTILVK